MKTILITGTSSGVGATIAYDYIEKGWNVIGFARSDSLFNYPNYKHYQVDIGDLDMVYKAFEQINDTKIDILVNNAAIFSTIPMSRLPFDQISIDEWDRMMSVNVKGTWLSCCAVLPQMRKQQYGKIINISSSTAIKGSPSRIHYVTSKAGIIGFTKTLANEVGGDNICVNCIAPGNTLSEVNPDEGILKLRTDAANVRALKRVQKPEDLTGAVLFFASEDSDFITGQTLVVDGGNCLH
jgi:3-oxoacyl-[acyl-carrier protein] reductase